MPLISKELIENRVISYSKKISKLLSVPEIHPTIRYRNLSTCAAYAQISDDKKENNILVFSNKFLKYERTVFFDWVVGHEVVHFYDGASIGDPHHAEEWQWLMIQISLPPMENYCKNSLKRYMLWYDVDWYDYSPRSLRSPNCTLIKFNKRDIKKDWKHVSNMWTLY